MKINQERVKFAAQLVGSLAVITIAALSLVPGSMRPHTGAPGTMEHIVAYLLTAGTLTLGYGTSRFPAIIALLLSLYSAALEIAQLQIPGRHAGIDDFIASSFGAFIGCLFAWIVLRALCAPSASSS
jgi:hypothetical protein